MMVEFITPQKNVWDAKHDGKIVARIRRWPTGHFVRIYSESYENQIRTETLAEAKRVVVERFN